MALIDPAQQAPSTIDPRELRDAGYLQEVNRRFFHPLGLELAVRVRADGTVELAGIWDGRADPEGCAFPPGDPPDATKAACVASEFRRRDRLRRRRLGWAIQPVG